jgi:hypothetical protein
MNAISLAYALAVPAFWLVGDEVEPALLVIWALSLLGIAIDVRKRWLSRNAAIRKG